MRSLFDVRWHTAPTIGQMVLNPIGGVISMIGLAFHHTAGRLYQMIGTARMVTTNVNCGSSFLKSDLSGELFLDRVEIFLDAVEVSLDAVEMLQPADQPRASRPSHAKGRTRSTDENDLDFRTYRWAGTHSFDMLELAVWGHFMVEADPTTVVDLSTQTWCGTIINDINKYI